MPQPDAAHGGSAATAAPTAPIASKDDDRLDRLSHGLDALEHPAQRRTVDWMAIVAPIVVVAGLIGIWQLVWWSAWKPESTLPSPLTVGSTLWSLVADGTAWGVVWTSLSRGLLGFVIAVVAGTVLGVLVGQVSLLRKGFRPLLSALQSLPSVAWVPFAIMWFGLGPATIYFVILLGAVPSVANGLIGGLDQTPPILRRAGQVLGAGRLGLVRHVLLPAALPTYLSGLKQGWAFSWRSLMAAEVIVNSPELGTGLGQLLQNGRDMLDMPTVIAAIGLILVVGVVVELFLFGPLERKVLRDRGLAASGL
ncbi:ABC transporter permease [Calidifontibacter sp. DB0510]|uniref:ABC transporter permease n=1 Tax=Metallococcus carri TaxID=1656884 RepID=A0A967B276_9MICO|nr:ABC transporter permease [Metallococcus carri]NHN54282.1 ABC transporter permease [Metallococcus carri]NOP36878.1 ABC transporter permease [Calidifontibacter sp. DB2511S]